jgi:hypothetical protein
MQEHATIYIPDPSLIDSRVLDDIRVIKSYEIIRHSGKSTGLQLTFEWGSIRMSFMFLPDLETHLDGLSGFVGQHIADTDTLVYTQARIQHVRMALGCVIEYSEDALQEMFNTLAVLTRFFGGMFFFLDYLYDFNCTPLGGIDHEA